MEQFYLPAYIRASLIPSLRASGKYQMLLVSDGKGHSWYAGDEDVTQGETAQPNGNRSMRPCPRTPASAAWPFSIGVLRSMYQDKVLLQELAETACLRRRELRGTLQMATGFRSRSDSC